jgi:hypothetical protein
MRALAPPDRCSALDGSEDAIAGSFHRERLDRSRQLSVAVGGERFGTPSLSRAMRRTSSDDQRSRAV